jgi:ABC-type branched-subunit amino acid transport system substrate-binding protein
MKMRDVATRAEQPPGSSLRPRKRHLRPAGAGLTALAMAWLVIGCYGSTQPIVKLGLVAPFEESHRDDGYAVLHAVKLAIGQRNAAGGVAGRQVALVALNDNGRPDEAAMQAAKLDVDRDVLGVVGPLAETTAAAAGTVLAGDGPAWLALVDAPPSQLVPPPGFAAAYRDVAGSDPSPQAVLAFERTNQLLDAINRASRSGPLSRETVRSALAELGTAGQ